MGAQYEWQADRLIVRTSPTRAAILGVFAAMGIVLLGFAVLSSSGMSIEVLPGISLIGAWVALNVVGAISAAWRPLVVADRQGLWLRRHLGQARLVPWSDIAWFEPPPLEAGRHTGGFPPLVVRLRDGGRARLSTPPLGSSVRGHRLGMRDLTRQLSSAGDRFAPRQVAVPGRAAWPPPFGAPVR
jgi:hypothetical protein